MSRKEPLLIEIGCEEIPALAIAEASGRLGRRVERILEQAGLAHGELESWGGPRRLAVRVGEVEARQAEREETVLGPPAKVAFDESGNPTGAAKGFARKQGVEAAELARVETERGVYAGFRRQVAGLGLGELLARDLPPAVESMSFPKTMRWGDGRHRWVRPVHWLLALHGERVLSIELFGVPAGGESAGHRFLGAGRVEVGHPARYRNVLESAKVLVDPAERRRRIRRALEAGAEALRGSLVEDEALLEEVADMVEWPGVVSGRFPEVYLDLPREILVTTLRHHQKCFSVQAEDGRPLAAFLAVANTDEDRGGHIRRGNEWVVGGRLEDARFFWREDRKRGLEARASELGRVVFHARAGSFADKAERMEQLAGELGRRLGLDAKRIAHCRSAARLAKVDLLTGTVGEFPELQGRAGGLLLREEGRPEEEVAGVYEQYQPQGPEDDVPASVVGSVVALADKLDSVARLIAAGETPSGSRDPYGLRRAGNGIVRILHERGWELTLEQLHDLTGRDERVRGFLRERLGSYFRELGYSANEILAVTRPRVSEFEALAWAPHDVGMRLAAIKQVRGREDFRNLVKLTQRVDNILSKDAEALKAIVREAEADAGYVESKPAALRLGRMTEEFSPKMSALAAERRYGEIVEILAGFIDPVETFFDEVLVIDKDDPVATLRRQELLARLRLLFTRYFDIRELAGEAERRGRSWRS